MDVLRLILFSAGIKVSKYVKLLRAAINPMTAPQPRMPTKYSALVQQHM